ncbi:hypothetical protein Tco_0646454 [Tanacetum coccineum]
MESSSSNSEERELQLMQLKGRQLHSQENVHSCDPKTCIDVLITQFKELFDSKEVNASDFHNKCWQNDFKDYMGFEPKTYRRNLLWYLDELEKHIDERLLKCEELWMKEREVQAIKEIEKRLKERDIQQQESLITKGITLDASLVTDGTSLDASLVIESIAMDDNLVAKESTDDSITSSEKLDEGSSSGNDVDFEKILIDTVASNIENADIGPSYNSDTVSEVHHDTFENVFANEIQSHEQPDFISNTNVVNENISDIISDIPNIDPDRDK